MPPKRLVHAQKLRDAFPEEQSCAVVERWVTETIEELTRNAEAAAKQRAAVLQTQYSRTNAESVPRAVMDVLLQHQDIRYRIFSGAEVVRTVISVRIPELKEEDNLGVAVQHGVMKLIDEIESKILGGGGGEKGGVNSPAGIFAPREYAAARGAVEDKLIGKKDEKVPSETTGSKSPSLLFELQQIDADFLLRVEMAAMQSMTSLRSFVNAYALNWKKLIQPRTSGDHMVS